jgi:hypothetical protein
MGRYQPASQSLCEFLNRRKDQTHTRKFAALPLRSRNWFMLGVQALIKLLAAQLVSPLRNNGIISPFFDPTITPYTLSFAV